MRFRPVGIFAVTTALGVALLRFRLDSAWQVAYWTAPRILPPVFVLAAAWYIMNSIEEFIHHQRLREVYYVLEKTYTAFRDRPEWLASPPPVIRSPAAEEAISSSRL